MEESKHTGKGNNERRRVTVLTDADIRAALRAPSGGYFLYGDEDYLKNHYAASLRAAALEDSAVPEMNLSEFDEDNYSPAALENAIATPPMMGSKRFVSLRLSDVSGMKEGEKEAFALATSSLGEYPETVFVFFVAAGGIDPGKPTAPSPQVLAFAGSLKLAPVFLQSEQKLIKWLGRHVAKESLTAEPAALNELIASCGREMFRLSSEVAKACAFVKSQNGSVLTVDAVRAVVSRTPEEGAFMLANAVMRGDRKTALTYLGRAVRRAEPPIRLLAGVTGVIADLCAVSQLMKDGGTCERIAAELGMKEYKTGLYMNAVRDVPPERLTRALDLCAKTDLKMKTTSSLGYAPLEMLVCAAADAARRDGAVWKR